MPEPQISKEHKDQLSPDKLNSKFEALGRKLQSIVEPLVQDRMAQEVLFTARFPGSSHDRDEHSWVAYHAGRLVALSYFLSEDTTPNVSVRWYSSDYRWYLSLYAGGGQFTDFLVKAELGPSGRTPWNYHLESIRDDPEFGKPSWDTNVYTDQQSLEHGNLLLPVVKNCVAEIQEHVIESIRGLRSVPLTAREVDLSDVLLRLAERKQP